MRSSVARMPFSACLGIEPSDNGWDRPPALRAGGPPACEGSTPSDEWSTVADPSTLQCFPASAISAKIWAAGALMTRSTLTVFPCTPAVTVQFDPCRDGEYARSAGVRAEHLGRLAVDHAQPDSS
jgi:hypothetical protein